MNEMGGEGTELPAIPSGNTHDAPAGGSNSGNTRPGSDPLTDPELARVVEAWPGLPTALRAGILAVVAAAGGKL